MVKDQFDTTQQQQQREQQQYASVGHAAMRSAMQVLLTALLTTEGAANKDSYMIGIEIGKLTGFELPNFFKNGQLGYAPNQHGFSDVY